jgi:hypothetical protein
MSGETEYNQSVKRPPGRSRGAKQVHVRFLTNNNCDSNWRESVIGVTDSEKAILCREAWQITQDIFSAARHDKIMQRGMAEAKHLQIDK